MQFKTLLFTIAALAPVFVAASCDQCGECVSTCTISNCPPGSHECDGWCTDFCSSDLGCSC
ncbi:hypothetical protein F5B22DRAFT_644711 [Xylaria bambusicola]|uniref:uncharacterized protein n=1 Tax=Xylaria bambusicola TaxID=326684 RepID=UPI002008D621|nr:uncharacterized protein F5B22DRAFT_644711 [Xylaria bambusicola]KAI0518404.1 hypothetical protein F5B22DRAFT_644711 [Xylaria bambusicola]